MGTEHEPPLERSQGIPATVSPPLPPAGTPFSFAQAPIQHHYKSLRVDVWEQSTQEKDDSKILSSQRVEQWNTKNLSQRLCVDFMAASAAGILVAPVITVIDRAIIENASNRATLSQSARSSVTHFFTRPHSFLLSVPVRLIFLLYAGTYSSANLLDTFTSTFMPSADSSAASTTCGTSKFAVTSMTNISLCLYKDGRFTKLFGATSGAAGRVPKMTRALFATRDSLTVFASFNLPPVIAPRLPVGPEVEKVMGRASIAQFLAPAAVQIISTPLHLLGLDLYNRPRNLHAVSWQSRAERVWRDWGKSCLARVARIVPAFGVGGVVNTSVRRTFMQKLE